MKFSKITLYDYDHMASIWIDDAGHRKGVQWPLKRMGRVTYRQRIKAVRMLKGWMRCRLNKFGCLKALRAAR